jgi:signal transduction histidine kinase
MEHSLEEHGIKIELVLNDDANIVNYKNEYKQVLLNLISNAKDILVERKIINPKIQILITEKTVIISDNAGGILSQNLNKIFEPYFTTKENSSGIGLYMSKMIVERNMGGKLTVRNAEDGAEFRIMF